MGCAGQALGARASSPPSGTQRARCPRSQGGGPLSERGYPSTAKMPALPGRRRYSQTPSQAVGGRWRVPRRPDGLKRLRPACGGPLPITPPLRGSRRNKGAARRRPVGGGKARAHAESAGPAPVAGEVWGEVSAGSASARSQPAKRNPAGKMPALPGRRPPLGKRLPQYRQDARAPRACPSRRVMRITTKDNPRNAPDGRCWESKGIARHPGPDPGSGPGQAPESIGSQWIPAFAGMTNNASCSEEGLQKGT